MVSNYNAFALGLLRLLVHTDSQYPIHVLRSNRISISALGQTNGAFTLAHPSFFHMIVKLVLAGLLPTLCLNGQHVVVHADIDVVFLVPGEVNLDAVLTVGLTVS